jgi:hypothetical protein
MAAIAAARELRGVMYDTTGQLLSPSKKKFFFLRSESKLYKCILAYAFVWQVNKYMFRVSRI